MRKKNVKKIRSWILSLFFIFAISFASLAFSGWNFVDGEFMYLNEEGKMLMDTFKESDGYYYYLGSDGLLLTYSMLEYGGYTYYVDCNGRQIRNDFVRIDETNNRNRNFEDGVYYFDENGRAYKRYGNKFIKYINNYYYAFDENGKILTGWLDKDGNLIENNLNVFSDGCYYANGDGILMHNLWYKFSNDEAFYNGDIEDSQLASEKYLYMDNLWMYFDKDSKKVVANSDKLLSKSIKGKKYAFDEYGVMIEGFTKNGNLDVSQSSNPSLTEKIKFYAKEEGDLQKKNWVKTVPSENMSDEDNSNNTESWFYIDGNGNIVNNILKSVDGKKYAFDGIGRMKSEFIMASDGKYVAQYKSEDLTRDDFMYHVTEGGQLYGSDLCDLYYFGVSEDLGGDGSMQKGEVKIELKDGIYDFKFKNNDGKVYGAHTTLENHDGMYYINGLKLCAWDDNKYGVVKISDEEYKVVDAKGKKQKANRKLLKDDYDNYFVIFGDRLAGYIEHPADNIQIKWRSGGDYGGAGYYYYNKDSEVKDFIGPAVLLDSICPTESELELIPEDERINYR